MVVQIGIKPLSARYFYGLADVVGIDAVLPAIAWVESQRRPKRRILAGRERRQFGVFLKARGVGVEEVVGESGGVGQQMPQRDRPFGGAKLGRALIIESLQHS